MWKVSCIIVPIISLATCITRRDTRRSESNGRYQSSGRQGHGYNPHLQVLWVTSKKWREVEMPWSFEHFRQVIEMAQVRQHPLCRMHK